jgi:hypothetical protein
MEDLQLALTNARVDQRNFGLWIKSWQIGQTLNALVTRQLPSGDLLLRVGGQQITATSDIPIQQGAQLRLEVKQLEPTPILRILNPGSAPEAAAAVNATLRLLPTPRGAVATVPAGGLMGALQSAQAALPLPPPLAASIDALLRLASRPERIGSSSGLAQAIRDSGVFLERRLAVGDDRPRATLGHDLKAAVLRTLAQARVAVDGAEAGRPGARDAQALAQLSRDLEAGLGRITLNQLATLPDDSPARAWQLEIPVYHASAFHTLTLRIESDDHRAPGEGQQDGDEAGWRVQLEFAPPALGAVHLDLRLRATSVALAVAAERGTTRQILDSATGQLEAALAARGFALEATPARSLVASAAVSGPLRAAGEGVDLRA